MRVDDVTRSLRGETQPPNVYESAAVVKTHVGGEGRATRSPATIEPVLPETSIPKDTPAHVCLRHSAGRTQVLGRDDVRRRAA
jgi:hypothetical protein